MKRTRNKLYRGCFLVLAWMAVSLIVHPVAFGGGAPKAAETPPQEVIPAVPGPLPDVSKDAESQPLTGAAARQCLARFAQSQAQVVDLSQNRLALSLKGDFSKNGRLDLEDAVLAAQTLTGAADAQLDCEAYLSGLSGSVAPADTVYILQCVAGLREVPTVCPAHPQPFPYPPSSTYTGMHGNRANSERVYCQGPLNVQKGWSALENHMIFQPVCFSADGKSLYAVATKTEDCKLLAVDVETGDSRCLEGENDGLTLGVAACGPEVDQDGYVYITDGWGTPGAEDAVKPVVICYHPEGGIRWRSEPLLFDPQNPPETYNAPLGMHFTPAGDIATVTVEGYVFLLDRAGGHILDRLSLPAETGFVSPEANPVEFDDIPKYLEENINEVIGPVTPDQLAYALGGGTGESGYFVDNTIGISCKSQLFIVGGRRPAENGEDEGGLFAVNIVEKNGKRELTYAWVMPITGGSGTSPTVDPRSRWVVVGDGASTLRVADICDCNNNTDANPDPRECPSAWTYQFPGDPLMASVSFDENGIVYAWNQGKDNKMFDIFAVRQDPDHPDKGKIVWEKSLGPDRSWASTALITNNVVIGTATHVITYYETDTLPIPIIWDCEHEIVGLDRFTGDILWRKPLPDDCINSPLLGPDGSVYVPLMGIMDLTSPNPDILYQGGIIQYKKENL